VRGEVGMGFVVWESEGGGHGADCGCRSLSRAGPQLAKYLRLFPSFCIRLVIRRHLCEGGAIYGYTRCECDPVSISVNQVGVYDQVSISVNQVGVYDRVTLPCYKLVNLRCHD
jgi:hypothetical protein